MLRNISKLECKVGERIYQLLCEMDSPTPDVKEALFQFGAFIAKIEETARENQNQASETPVEPDQAVEEVQAEIINE